MSGGGGTIDGFPFVVKDAPLWPADPPEFGFGEDMPVVFPVPGGRCVCDVYRYWTTRRVGFVFCFNRLARRGLAPIEILKDCDDLNALDDALFEALIVAEVECLVHTFRLLATIGQQAPISRERALEIVLERLAAAE